MSARSVASRSGHRPSRETPAKEISHYKQESRTLRKQVARLQKELQRASASVDQLSAKPEVDLSGLKAETGVKCPKCLEYNTIGHFTTPGGKTVSRCRVCKV